ncbi:unnamed protein product, partial [Porites evermanni]
LIFRSSHLGVTDNQKRWLVFGIALNKILVPQIRPFVEQEVDKEYNNLKTSHNIHTQSTSGRLQRWPARKFLKYENINGNSCHPKLPGGKYNISLFDCRVLSHIDFAKLYVENFMAKFSAFGDHCDASAVLTLLGGVPVFSAAMQAAAGDVRIVRNDWAHCVFSKWDPVKFQQSFVEMEHLVRVMALPAADEAKLLGELKDWETKGTMLCMNSPVDPALLQLIQQEVKFLQDNVSNLSVEFEQERVRVQQELQNAAITLEDMKQTVERLKNFQGNPTCLTSPAHFLITDVIIATNIMVCWFNPGKLVELIRRDYKGAVLCPFPWCEDELQLKLSNIFTRLQIVSRKKERSQLTGQAVNMTEVFKSHPECSNPRVVLIEGNPGMGKTTYCQKLAHDWSVGEIPPDASFPDVNILLLLKCRDMHMKTANIEEAIDDQLIPHDANKKEKEDLFHFIRTNQSRILLVLDGLDELREDLLEGFLPLIQGKVFSNVNLMLTARHEAGMRLRRYCDTLLELVGYLEDDVESYINKYFSSHEDQSLADKMIKHLRRDKQLAQLTANPLNTALLCLLCEETRGVFPSKRTMMYDELVSCALRRYFAKRGISLGDQDPMERCASELNQLGKMALDALLKNQLYFIQDEVKSRFANTDFLRLPFLSREPSVSKVRPTPTYAFTHKTFQEYFAAFFLAHQLLSGDKGKERLLDELSPIDNWQVWEFLITIVLSKSVKAAVTVVSRLCAFFCHKRPLSLMDVNRDDADLDRREIFKDSPYDWAKYLRKMNKDEGTLCNVLKKTLDLIAECEDGDDELKDYQKEVVRVLARCFPIKKLDLTLSASTTCSVYSEYLRLNYSLTDLTLHSAFDLILLKTIEHVFHSKQNLVHFTFLNSTWVFDSFISVLFASSEQEKAFSNLTQVLADFLQINQALTHLNLRHAMIYDVGAILLSDALQSNSKLTHLSLPENWISVAGAFALAATLKFNSVLTYLDLSQNLGGDSFAVALSKALESNCTLKYLNLCQWFDCIEKNTPFPESANVHVEMIGPEGGSALAKALRFNCTLTYLDLQYNNIGDSGAAALGEALRTNTTLKELYLKDNKIGEIGSEALGKGLQSNRTLTHLNLECNHDIGDSGASAIAKALQSRGSKLTWLDLSLNKISSSGATSISEALCVNSSLTHLGLGSNKINSSGASAIAKSLQSNRTLIHLDLGGNEIGDSGAKEFAHSLTNHNNTLGFLNL